ncbi:hypothetical protein BCV70DRAFT_115428 [Testicularia cyperi]|uniref:Uncharacterized protein n=1 Tax=Testicularia cyperi TaxID=1882483 RepID=A0A317XN10_9BASI|nr:hypothetical protein BCV70DRAFT_115428 [Testicularia cyperi]
MKKKAQKGRGPAGASPWQDIRRSAGRTSERALIIRLQAARARSPKVLLYSTVLCFIYSNGTSDARTRCSPFAAVTGVASDRRTTRWERNSLQRCYGSHYCISDLKMAATTSFF